MALTPDQKEAIILTRGEKEQESGPSKTRIYRARFTSGKGCTVLDMTGDSAVDAISSIETVFGAENVASIE